ncbi:MAG: helix-turn-helix transcriptional regulator [Propionibacteriaceae bacterium]|jgi:DNA-binding CsgD family transcriptional regulator|nr:helix-turn-helix transcriptional regulator [Propionibacteriaceae bacterium]
MPESFIPFRQQIEQALNFAQDGIGSHFVGLPFSGRSELLESITRGLKERGRTVLALSGNAAWQNQPMAAFANTPLSFLAEAGRRWHVPPGAATEAGAPDPVEAISSLSNHLVIVATQADLLDRHTIGAITAAHQAHGFVVITSSSPSVFHPGTLMANVNKAIRVNMPTLTMRGADAVIVDILGEPLESRGVAAITRACGGLYGLIRSVTIVGKQTQSLVPIGNRWRAVGPLWSPMLSGIAQSFVASFDEPTLEAATALALAGMVLPENADGLVSPDQLRILTESGVIQFQDSLPGSPFALHPPLLATYLRERVKNASGSSITVPDGVTKLLDAWRADKTAQTALPLWQAMRRGVRPDHEIDQVMRGTTRYGDDLLSGKFMWWKALWIEGYAQDSKAAEALVDEALPNMPHYRSLLRAAKARVRFISNRPIDPNDLQMPGPDEDPYTLLPITSLTVEAAIAAGLTFQADAALEGFSDLVEAHIKDAGDIFVHLSAYLPVLNRILAGDLDRGITDGLLAMRRIDQRASLRGPAVAYAVMLGHLVAGRFGAASTMFEKCISLSAPVAIDDLFSFGAHIALLQGDREYALSLMSRWDTSPAGAGEGSYVAYSRAPGMAPEPVRVLTNPNISDAERCAQGWDLVLTHLNGGHVSSAMFMAIQAVYYGPCPEAVGPITQALTTIESPMIIELTRLVLAANDGDIPALDQAIAEMSTHHWMLFAIRGQVAKALLLYRQGESVAGALAAHYAWKLAGSEAVNGMGIFEPIAKQVGLSHREYEVIDLVAQGMTAAEAAGRLYLSTRTVETHLRNITTKTGISHRDNLIEAVRTWLHEVRQTPRA